MAYKDEKYKRHSIGMNITKGELEAMKLRLKKFREKYKEKGYSRNDVLKVICMRLLDDDELIELCEKKGGLS